MDRRVVQSHSQWAPSQKDVKKNQTSGKHPVWCVKLKKSRYPNVYGKAPIKLGLDVCQKPNRCHESGWSLINYASLVCRWQCKQRDITWLQSVEEVEATNHKQNKISSRPGCVQFVKLVLFIVLFLV